MNLDAARISAATDHIIVHVPDGSGPWRVESRAVYEPDDGFAVLFVGDAPQSQITIARHTDTQDRLLHRFRITNNDTTRACWVTDARNLATHTRPMPWPDEVKGVSCPVDYDDLVELGARHTHINIGLPSLLLPDDADDPAEEWIRESEGVRLRFNPDAVRSLDHQVSELSRRDVNVIAVILNRLSDGVAPNSPWKHRNGDVADAPFDLYAFNLSNRPGVARFVGVMGFLAERYSRPDKPDGWIGGYIIGNEVDSHWTWHNMGTATLDEVARQHIDEVRLAWLAVRQHHAEVPVFVSLTHSWARANSADPMRNVAGKELFDQLVLLSGAEGAFDWNVAYHPYPQDLRNPRFWQDTFAVFGYDTPKITFKNLEVLAAYLREPRNRVAGKPRRLILSEQGFDTPAGPDGEDIQAAAYALSYERIRQVPQIEAYILHRHVDHRGEFGLRLGLRYEKPAPAPPSVPDAKKKSWHVFRAAGTPRWEGAVRFALPIVGLSSWDEARVAPGPFPEHAPEITPHLPDNAIVDLVRRYDDAQVHDALEFSVRLIPHADGGVSQGLYLHPKGPDAGPARAVFSLALPKRTGLAFICRTHLDPGQGDGVTFRARINHHIMIERDATQDVRFDHRVDLSPYAGQTVTLTLEVDPKSNNQHDWATWVEPLIVADKE